MIASEIMPVFGVVSESSHVERMLEAAPTEVLPKNVKVVYKPYSATEFVVWIHNLNEKSVKVPVAALQENASQSVTLEELSLSANQPKAEMLKKKLLWNGAKRPSLESVYNNSESKFPRGYQSV